MSKNLEEKFRSFCNSKNLEINQNQITTIKLLQDFYNKNFHSSIFNIFKKVKIKKASFHVILPQKETKLLKHTNLKKIVDKKLQLN